MKQWFLTHRYGLTVALVAAMILLPFLGAAPLMDPDEPVYGETAREMLLAGDWLSPRIFGQYWYDNHRSSTGWKCCRTAFSASLTSHPACPASSWPWRRRCTSTSRGRNYSINPSPFLSALFLVTSAGFMYIGKAAVTDMTLMFTLTVTMVSFYRKKRII